MSNKKYDFSGWATKNDLKCSDGRTIRRDAFKDNDGKRVSLVWNHDHNDPMNVLGHADLENRDEGVYAYCTLNETAAGQHAKQLVQHGDIVSLSIWANRLQQVAGDVIHGDIKEVSLVLAGANPGATIDCIISHSGDVDEEQAIVYYDQGIILSHAEESSVPDDKKETTEKVAEDDKKAPKEPAEEKEMTVKDIWDTFTEDEKTVTYALIGQAIEDAKAEKNGKQSEEIASKEGKVSHADDDENGPTVAEVFDNMSEDKKNVVYLLIGQAIENMDAEEDEDGEEDEESDEGGKEVMKHNVFDAEEKNGMNVLSHDDEKAILANGKRIGSLREAVLQYTESTGNELILKHDDEDTPTYGIDNVDYLFPDYHLTSPTPVFIKRDDEWVAKFLGAVHKTPFARIKSIFADITDADARAKGYITGAQKLEEIFGLLNRTTDPTTIYKKQKMDRDNLLDITSFDVVAWLKGEMRIMLNEEVAGAALLGDGRNAGADKISETNIRPIWTDDDLFTIKYRMEIGATATDDDVARTIIKGAVKSRKGFKGTGKPTLFVTEDDLTNMLLMEDLNGRVIYEDEEKLARALRVKEIVTVPVMENRTRTVTLLGGGTETRTLRGIIVNPADYDMGTNKGGEINMFDDFDIDYNQQKYLIETRCSGALTIPYSAIALETVVSA